MSRRAVTSLGVLALGGAGYYFYRAGGDPKTAQKIAEQDAAKASAKLKEELPGSTKEAKKEGELWAHKAGAKIDETVEQARAKGNKAWADANTKASDLKADANAKFEAARAETNKTIDQIDRTVEQKAAEAKSGLSGWFGSSKK